MTFANTVQNYLQKTFVLYKTTKRITTAIRISKAITVVPIFLFCGWFVSF